MRLFGRRDSLRELKQDLRARRPEPRDEFAEGLERMLEAEPAAVRLPSARLRVGVALALTLGLAVVMAVFGGYSYAQSAVTSSATSTVDAVKSLVGAESQNSSATARSTQSNFCAANSVYPPPSCQSTWSRPPSTSAGRCG